ncbi:hypothetical protein HRG_004361 [Hirsutella rhossiliensis]
MDDSSRARLVPGRGIWARNKVKINLRAKGGTAAAKLAIYLERHLRLNSDVDTPLVSASDDPTIAFDVVDRRQSARHQGMTVVKTNIRRVRGNITYRSARKFALKLGVDMPDNAWHTSEREFVFASNILQDAIDKAYCFENTRRS